MAGKKIIFLQVATAIKNVQRALNILGAKKDVHNFHFYYFCWCIALSGCVGSFEALAQPTSDCPCRPNLGAFLILEKILWNRF